ncbi:TonB-dependent receptor [Rugamonas sp. CCM 8940]|uniref:TonB-dependent receptor plug domain-containing protein n=1 Tax=Rugamonas sp. CCM 8940 TaxID=2765359 RepID=UPI001A2A01AC|nr:TonB-dependent receptor [Rugamonas sp. CCM 8940]MBJ7310813.1 TonB-dependent receptor [Rugamonas sp. CCM 8940]
MSAALLLPAGPARAVEHGGNDLTELSLEELGAIDVSAASLLGTGLLDAASSVSVVLPEQWQRAGAHRLLDALEGQPGVLVLPHTSGNQVLAVRGYARSTSYTGVASSWDGVPLSDLFRAAPQFNLPNISLGALSQIQLIAGPGSALYGSDAFHALVALRGYEAASDQRSLRGTAGSNGYYDAALQLSQGLEQAGRVNLALAANGQPGQDRIARAVNPLNGQPLVVVRANRYATQTLSLKYLSEPERPLSWFANLALHHDTADAFQGLGTRLSGGDDLGWLDSRFLLGQAGVRRQLERGGWLEWKAYYWRIDNDLASHLRLASGAVRRDLRTEQFRGGWQATYRAEYRPWRTDWALALGDEWLGVNRARAGLATLAGAPLDEVRNPAEGARRRVHSATLEVNTHWAERRWGLVYGGRLDDYSDFGRHVSPRLGLVYRPQDDSAIKLLYGQAFRAPSAVELGGAQGSVLGNASLKPEVIDSYELVALRQRADSLLQLTLFRTLWRDGIAAMLLAPNKLSQYLNVERNDAYGASASLHWQGGGWLLDAAGSYVRSRNSRSGATYNLFPTTMFSVAVGRAVFDPSCQLYVSQRWQAATDDVPTTEGFPAQRLRPYARTDVTLSKLLSPQLSASLQLRNLFDRDNRLPSPPASLGGIPDERFGVNLSLQYRF